MATRGVTSAVHSKHNNSSPAGKTTTIRQKTFIPASVPEVYDAFLREETHAAFTGAKATCDRRVGGRFTAWDGYISGTNLKLENGRRIVQEWRTSEWPRGYKPSILEFTFIPRRDGTEVRIVHREVPAAQAESYRKGWITHYWNPLKAYFGDRH